MDVERWVFMGNQHQISFVKFTKQPGVTLKEREVSQPDQHQKELLIQ